MPTAAEFERLGEAAPSADADLKATTTIADELLVAYQRQKFYEDKLKIVKGDILNLECERLPAAMAAANLSEFKLADGTKITVEPLIDAYISEERRPAALTWLREHGHEGIIKPTVTVELPKGNDTAMRQVVAELEKLGVPVVTKDTVHPSTLKAWVKELFRTGQLDVPLELFGIFTGQRAKVKFPKA